MPLVSVIIPAYNCEKTIRETIESVLNQTVSDFELIVINDGSPDSTLEVASGIKDSRIKIFSYPNAGVSASRNRGISHARGEFIAFLDADDLWMPNKLEAQLKALQDNPQAQVAYSWMDCIDELGQFLRRGSYITENGNIYAKLLLMPFVETGSNPLIRAEALASVGGFDESLSYGEDWDLYLRLAARFHFVAVPYPHILYRVSANSASANVVGLEAGSLQVIERAFHQAPIPLPNRLRQYSLSNLYKYLTYKTLQGVASQQRGLTSARFLWHALRNDPSLLRSRVLIKVLFIITAMVLLMPQQAQALLNDRFRVLSNIDALLGYFRFNPSE